MRVLLDTNAYVAFKRGDPDVTARLRRSERVLLSAVVGELFYGFRHGSRFERDRTDLHAFLDRPFVMLLPVTLATADRFGRVAAQLRTKGRPIPTNDAGSRRMRWDRVPSCSPSTGTSQPSTGWSGHDWASPRDLRQTRRRHSLLGADVL